MASLWAHACSRHVDAFGACSRSWLQAAQAQAPMPPPGQRCSSLFTVQPHLRHAPQSSTVQAQPPPQPCQAPPAHTSLAHPHSARPVQAAPSMRASTSQLARPQAAQLPQAPSLGQLLGRHHGSQAPLQLPSQLPRQAPGLQLPSQLPGQAPGGGSPGSWGPAVDPPQPRHPMSLAHLMQAPAGQAQQASQPITAPSQVQPCRGPRTSCHRVLAPVWWSWLWLGLGGSRAAALRVSISAEGVELVSNVVHVRSGSPLHVACGLALYRGLPSRLATVPSHVPLAAPFPLEPEQLARLTC